MKPVGAANPVSGLGPNALESGFAKNQMDDEVQTATPPSYFTFRPRPDDQQKTIVITGVPRGGTSFAASIVARLGISFCGGKHDAASVGRRFSHTGLKSSLVGNDHAQFVNICEDISRQQDVWAFKHPVFPFNSDFARCLRNPHYVIIFKEPLSVTMRSYSIRGRSIEEGKDVAESVKTAMKVYAAQLDFCIGADVPAMFISYDRAMRDRERTVRGVAQFLGVHHYDEAAVLSSIGDDRDYYFEASTVHALRRSPDWRRRVMGWVLGKLRVPK